MVLILNGERMIQILIPTDFSDNAQNAINYAQKLFINERCTFYLVNTYTPIIYNYDVEKTTTKGKEVIRVTMPFYDRISTHTARRTFITMMKNKGKSDQLIAKITGHSDMTTLNHYYIVDDTAKKEAVDDTFDIDIPLKKVR